MSITLQRPAPPAGVLPLLSREATGRLERFVPPFEFTSFFAPEDTLLCVIAAERALACATRAARGVGAPPQLQGRADATRTRHPGDEPGSDSTPAPHVVELTAGSGLIGLRLLDLDPDARLLGIDVDLVAPLVARRNAESLGMAGRARFACASVLEAECEALLADAPIDVLICNPPYIPEPPGMPLAVEAGSGADGAAHLRRVAELAARLRPRTVALSWCSLGDPVGVTEAMERAGYQLDALYAVAIADGEYSGMVQPYLETLPTAFLNGDARTRAALAGDESARFGYVLLAGAWVRGEPRAGNRRRAAQAVGALMRGFADRGLDALVQPEMPCEYHGWLLDRWDEIALRALLHGPVSATPS